MAKENPPKPDGSASNGAQDKSGAVAGNSTGASPNSDLAKAATAFVALTILILVACWAVWMAWYAQQDSYVYFDGDKSKFYLNWKILRLAVEGGTAVEGLLVLAGIASIGARLMARGHRNLWPLLAVCCICLLGTAACILLLSESGDAGSEMILSFRAKLNSTEAAVQAQLNWFFRGMLGWFAGFLAAQLKVDWKQAKKAAGGMFGGD